MRMKQVVQVALSAAIALMCSTPAWSHAEVFSDYSLAQAKQQAQKDSKLLVIDFMATWCPPCRQMESTTWANDAVQKWIKENAIAIQIDVDKDRKAASQLAIEAMPTIVLFTPKSGEKEFGRQVGYLSSSELLQWLEGAKSGKTSEELEKQLEQSQEDDDSDTQPPVSGSGGNTPWQRIGTARQLLTAGKNEEALEEYIWLWNNIDKKDSNLYEARNAMVRSEMGLLLRVFPAGKPKIVQLRDAAEKAENRSDWILLNGALEENEKTLAWFDKLKVDPKQKDTIIQYAALLEPVLFLNFRLADAATYLYPEPLVRINEYYKRAQDMKKPRPDTEFAKDFDPFPSMVLSLYSAYVGAGRDAEAQKIAEECIRLDDTQTMRDSLDSVAKSMKQARATPGKTTTTK